METKKVKKLLNEDHISKFKAIVKTISDFEERVRPDAKNETGHNLRKALAFASNPKVYLRQLNPVHYYIVAEFEHDSYSVSLAWVVEDGFVSDRALYAEDLDNPVHRLTSLTDLYELSDLFDVSCLDSSSATFRLIDKPIG